MVGSLLRVADGLAGEGNLWESIRFYIRAYATGAVSAENLDNFVVSVIGHARSPDILTRLKNATDLLPLFCCLFCQYILQEPITISCGHTFCKQCLLRDSSNNACPVCGTSFFQAKLATLRVNVLVSTFLEKLCPEKAKSSRKYYEGLALLKQNVPLATGKFTEALEADPSNHLARAALCMNNSYSTESLQSLNSTIEANPTWAKGYEYKGELLKLQGKIEEASVCYLMSLYLHSVSSEPNQELKKELKENLHKIFHPSSFTDQENLDDEFGASISGPMSFSPFNVPSWRERSGSSGSLSSFGSYSDSEISCDDEQILTQDMKKWQRQLTCHVQEQIFHIIMTFYSQVKKLTDEIQDTKVSYKANSIDKKDFECPLCFRYFWQPMTTPCGHTYCRTCLERCMDHQAVCPLCKASLSQFQQEKWCSGSYLVDYAMQIFIPHEYAERQKSYREELQEFVNAGKDSPHLVPLFVCTMAYPTIPCPLHVYEPQYRLMLRQCLESGTHQFGMCTFMENEEYGLPNYGTMLEIRELEYLPDGRAVVNGLGNKRFKILKKGMKDGYHTGVVEFLEDVPPSTNEEIERIDKLHDDVRLVAEKWFLTLPADTRRQVLRHFGQFPAPEPGYHLKPNGPSWCWWLAALLPLEHKYLMIILAMTSLRLRLETFQRILHLLLSRKPL